MPETKILRFPRSYAGSYGDVSSIPHIVGIHDADVSGRGIVAYVDVANLDERRLLSLVAENHVKAVVDVRPCPVFPKPRFRHKEVVFHLYRRGIPYIEMAMLAIWPVSERRIGVFMQDETYAALEDGLDRGLTICLFDEDARKDGWLEETRRMVRHTRGFAAELLPTALAGQG